MKKINTWMTIALGGLVTVTVAAVAIVWSGNRTEENPQVALESTHQQAEENDFAQAVMENNQETEAVPDDEPEPGTENVLHQTWEVEEDTYTANRQQQNTQVVQNVPPVQEPDTQAPEQEEVAEAAGDQVYSLNFASGETMGWPVQGNVIQHYSMDTTVYFPTLKQYKCSPAMEIQSEAGTIVAAPANARVAEVGEDARIGGYVRMELGNDYQVILGQLADICVAEGDYVARGAQIGTVAAPTRYFVVEGDNLYFQMLHGEETVDPLDYLE